MTAATDLPARLDSAAAPALAASLAGFKGTDLQLDASATELLGALAQQVLASAAATWRQDGHAFEIVGIPPRIRDQIRVLGLEDTLLRDAGEDA